MKKSLTFLALSLFVASIATIPGCKKDPDLQTDRPTLSTAPVSLVTNSTATAGGTIIDNGGAEITSFGVCWSTEPNPTINDDAATPGSGSSGFTCNLTDLYSGTLYYIRAYAVNSAGIAYGEELFFTTSNPQGGSWAHKADFPGGVRYGAARFTIGTKVYIGLGYNDSGYPARDLWEWDQVTGNWTKKADYTGIGTGGVVCFSIGLKGYVGTGYSFNTSYSNEFWEYDSELNSWSQKAYLPVTEARAWGVGFSIGTKGYIGTGLFTGGIGGSSGNGDFWEWDQDTNTWTKKADFLGSGRFGAVGFSIGNKGYIGTGQTSTANSKDFWEWDQATNVWTKKADFGGRSRVYAIGFAIGNKGYIGTGSDGPFGTGSDGPSIYNDFWEWDQSTDKWKELAHFSGNARANGIGFSIGNKGYIGIGSGNFDEWDYTGGFLDLWEMTLE